MGFGTSQMEAIGDYQRRMNMEMSQRAERQSLMSMQGQAYGYGSASLVGRGLYEQQQMQTTHDQLKIKIRGAPKTFREELQKETDKWLD